MATRVNKKGGNPDPCLISELPIAMLHEIFSRLSIEDILKCKCVCPKWNNLLSEPSFSKVYATISPFTSVLLCTERNYPAVDLLEFSDDGDSIRSRIWSRLLDRLVTPTTTYIGSCNGFLCMKLSSNGFEIIYIFNPIIGDVIRLPGRRAIQEGDRTCTVTYNFGFVPSTEKFKILRIVFMSGFSGECEILTVGENDNWRRLTDAPIQIHPDCVSVALNGFFHWIPEHRGVGLISTFDLEREINGEMSLPPGLVLVPKHTTLVVFGNQLSLVDFSVPSQVSVWIMKRYGVAGSWNKSVILTSWFPSELPINYLVPVAELRNGDLLFQICDHCLISCNIEQKRCSRIGLQVFERLPSYFIPTYTPNFSCHADLVKGRGCRVLLSDLSRRTRGTGARDINKSSLQGLFRQELRQ